MKDRCRSRLRPAPAWRSTDILDGFADTPLPAADRLVRGAFHLVGSAFSLELLVVGDVAGAFFHAPFEILHLALEPSSFISIPPVDSSA